MKYRILFSIQLLHRYYINGKCGDVEIWLDEACAQTIQRYRLVAKRLPYGIQFLIPVTGSDDLIPLEANVVFRFFLRLKNDAFLQFTDFDEDLAKRSFKGYEFPYYSNEGLGVGGGVLPLTTYKHRGTDRQFVADSKARERFFLQGLPFPGMSKGRFMVEGLELGQSILEYEESTKSVWIDTKNQPKGKSFWIQYDTFPAWPSDVFAVVDVANNQSLSKDAAWPDGATFQIQFEARKAIWKYYVISNADGLAIAAPFTFSAVHAPDPLADKLKAKYSGATLTLFASEKAIEYQEKVVQDIKLSKNNKVLIPHLPNPKPSESGIQIINIFQPNHN